MMNEVEVQQLISLIASVNTILLEKQQTTSNLNSNGTEGNYGQVMRVNNLDDYNALISYEKVIVNFSSKSCMPCRMMAPVYETLARQFKNVKFLHVDVREAAQWNDDLADTVTAVPTFKFYNDAVLLHEIVGARKSALEETAARLAKAS